MLSSDNFRHRENRDGDEREEDVQRQNEAATEQIRNHLYRMSALRKSGALT